MMTIENVLALVAEMNEEEKKDVRVPHYYKYRGEIKRRLYDDIIHTDRYNELFNLLLSDEAKVFKCEECGEMCENIGKKIGGTFMNLLCNDNPTEDELYECSVENFVTAESSPAFMVHTSNDQVVNVENSLRLAEAYRKAKIKFELHIYPDAPHGMALGNKITKCGVDKFCNDALAKWVEQAAFWADNLD